MVEADVGRLGEGEHMMVAVPARAAECDDVLRMVGEPHAERAGDEVDACRHVGREKQDMAELQRAHRLVARLGQYRRAAGAHDPSGRVDRERLHFGQRRVLGMLDEVDQHPMRVPHPQPFGLEAGRSIDGAAFMVRHLGRYVVERFGAQPDMVQPLGGRAADQGKAVAVLSLAAEARDPAVARAGQPGVGIEFHAGLELRDLERERQQAEHRHFCLSHI